MQPPGTLVYRSPHVSIVDVTIDKSTSSLCTIVLRNASLVFVRSGLFIKECGDQSIAVDLNYTVFGCEGTVLRAAPDVGEPCACTIIAYADATAFGPLASCGAHILCRSRTYLLHARLLKMLRSREPHLDAAASQLLLDTITDAGAAKLLRPAHSRSVRQIRELVNRRASKHVLLRDVAQQLYLSPFTISRLFRREIGVPLRSYVCRLRLRKALNLILDGASGLTEIALELGFYDEPHFSKAFHVEFGISPAHALASLQRTQILH